MYDATCDALSNSTSPLILPSGVRNIPTSTTTLFFFNIFPFTIFSPTAETTISAVFIMLSRFSVFEWQVVTVAFSNKKACAVGLPTRLERPMTTTCLPSISILYSLRSIIIPRVVQGIAYGS